MQQHGQEDALGRRGVDLVDAGGGEVLRAVKEPVEQLAVLAPQRAVETPPLLAVLFEHLVHGRNGSAHIYKKL